jgi:hypothetical protein
MLNSLLEQATMLEIGGGYMAKSDQNPKYRIEAWFSVLTFLHSCLGLNREGDSHPQCKKVLHNLIQDIEELMKSL